MPVTRTKRLSRCSLQPVPPKKDNKIKSRRKSTLSSKVAPASNLKTKSETGSLSATERRKSFADFRAKGKNQNRLEIHKEEDDDKENMINNSDKNKLSNQCSPSKVCYISSVSSFEILL